MQLGFLLQPLVIPTVKHKKKSRNIFIYMVSHGKKGGIRALLCCWNCSKKHHSTISMFSRENQHVCNSNNLVTHKNLEWDGNTSCFLPRNPLEQCGFHWDGGFCSRYQTVLVAADRWAKSQITLYPSPLFCSYALTALKNEEKVIRSRKVNSWTMNNSTAVIRLSKCKQSLR